jgi:uncharacterized protein YndB with AHSA1/START domain
MSYDLRLERLIDAAPEEVFDAFVDRDAMKDWYRLEPSWETDVPDHDPRVGGHTSVVFGGEEKYREDITYAELDRPSRIVYEEKMGRVVQGDFFVTRVVVTLEAQGTKTLLTLVQEGFHDEARRDAHQGGWPQFLDRLEHVVAARRTS